VDMINVVVWNGKFPYYHGGLVHFTALNETEDRLPALITAVSGSL
jgi:hypothetical protein